MLGLEDLPHAAGPDLVEDRVVAEDQRLGPALHRFPGPETSSGACSGRVAGPVPGRPSAAALGGTKFSSLPGAMTPGVGKLLDELFKGDSHHAIP